MKKVNPGCTNLDVHNLWVQVLALYFKIDDSFGIELQSNDPLTNTHDSVNYEVKSLRESGLETVFLLQAKQPGPDVPPRAATGEEWEKALDELNAKVEFIRHHANTIGHTFCLLAIGCEIQFYCLSQWGGRFERWYHNNRARTLTLANLSQYCAFEDHMYGILRELKVGHE
ncbi:hypothetical protein N7456_008089 [Penicillium angulare]|uniref:Uncharacterized protein n=1 Tax=Penicillium angulare TaxID=116970 RepID=A0A9W9FBV2_9EURO|nr:hypothetical protein N7456_008089 [Penicillium angulare]